MYGGTKYEASSTSKVRDWLKSLGDSAPIAIDTLAALSRAGWMETDRG